MADAMEAARQDMDQEPADELVGAERHDLLAIRLGATVILVAGGDAVLVEGRSGGCSRSRPGGCSATGRPAPLQVSTTGRFRECASRTSLRSKSPLTDELSFVFLCDFTKSFITTGTFGDLCELDLKAWIVTGCQNLLCRVACATCIGQAHGRISPKLSSFCLLI
jgi:hypothetical protein